MEARGRLMLVPPRGRRRRAFTLVELLVVIAILSILMAILMPVFARAKNRARGTACEANLKSIGTALNLYVQDYDGGFPTEWSPGHNTTWLPGGWEGWEIDVMPYVKTREIFQCPMQAPVHMSYGIAGWATSFQYRREFEFEKPAATVMVADQSYPNWHSVRAGPYDDDGDPDIWNVALRHEGRVNICFVDGHVKCMSWEQTIPPNENIWSIYAYD
jgi:prepilin-type N-terminal cleavage/methylation domain-containing protein/prepilin-type processing-associated H-X9-DG protein